MRDIVDRPQFEIALALWFGLGWSCFVISRQFK
jgi:hypothetical protein